MSNLPTPPGPSAPAPALNANLTGELTRLREQDDNRSRNLLRLMAWQSRWEGIARAVQDSPLRGCEKGRSATELCWLVAGHAMRIRGELARHNLLEALDRIAPSLGARDRIPPSAVKYEEKRVAGLVALEALRQPTPGDAARLLASAEEA